MSPAEEHDKKYEFFRDITGVSMKVHNKYHGGLLESAYEVALKYLLEKQGYAVERQASVPMYWDDVRLEQDYRIDLLVNGNIILELKAIKHIDTEHRHQLWNYMRLTHLPYGMLINFSPTSLYSEWYEYDDQTKDILRVKLWGKRHTQAVQNTNQ